MSSTLEAILASWPNTPWLWAAAAWTAAVYGRGWWELHRRDRERWRWRQPIAFGGGLAAMLLALASPIEPLAALLLQAHMVQHLLLMMVAPPLLWLGDPLFPCLRGLPRSVRRDGCAPLLRADGLRQAFDRLTWPPVALVVYTAVAWLGHVPGIYETALRSDGWHVVQHTAFLAAALLFWYPVVRPYPSRPSWSAWLLIPYLVLADVGNTVLAALITFSGRVLYPYYEGVPRLAGLSALDDQAAAGVWMWVPGSVAFLLPLFAIGLRLVSGPAATQGAKRLTARRAVASEVSLPAMPEEVRRPGIAHHSRPAGRAIDVLRFAILGRLLT
ncbi:MAG TPA: cytochrome c oxidase assembly protein, partial [Pirellulales bacterium]|nr:cytochrome c oxidase assembly protein [Pirellulales bacterium]